MGINECLKDVPCPECGQTGQVHRISRHETVSVRGLEFEVEKVLRRCNACAAEFENTKDADWRIEAYAAYRAAKGMVSPESIRAWRKEYDLKQAEVTALLGWGEVTLGRYENGSLQTEAHDKQLSDLMDPGNLARAVASTPGALSEERRAAILLRIRERQELLAPREVRIIRLKYGLSEADMEHLLALPEATFGRWERGEEIQGKAADTLLREMAEQPEIVRSLLGKSGVDNAVAQGVLHRIDENVERLVAEAIRRQFGSLDGVDIDKLVHVATAEFRRAQSEVVTKIGAAA
jgi:putative zinc finger/helix-turn-helix YgiT family protein